MNYPKVALIYLSFHCEPYMDDVVSALKKITYPKDRLEFVIVDNPHPQYGSSVGFIEDTVTPLSGKEISHVTLLAQKDNLGFAAGNNEGIKWALANGFDYVFLYNQDGFMASNCLEPLVEAMENDKTIGAAQSLMLLHPETEFVNSAGNAFQYLGFGFCSEYRLPLCELNFPPVKEVAYASGAAILMRADLLKQYGLLDSDFFMYHEDLEYSFRLRVVGYKNVLIRDSVFYHKYQFSRSISKFYWMERNRYGTMLMYFRWPTLLLLLPMELVLEIGLWLFALKGGWAKERIKVYQYWLKPSSWKLWLGKRKHIQSIRKVGDKELFKNSVSGIYFQEKSMENPILKFIGNPVMDLYYRAVMRLIGW